MAEGLIEGRDFYRAHELTAYRFAELGLASAPLFVDEIRPWLVELTAARIPPRVYKQGGLVDVLNTVWLDDSPGVYIVFYVADLRGRRLEVQGRYRLASWRCPVPPPESLRAFATPTVVGRGEVPIGG